MASKRIDLGRLIAVVIVAALVVAGCGGRGSSASSTAGTSPSTTASSGQSPSLQAGSGESESKPKKAESNPEGAKSGGADESGATSGSKSSQPGGPESSNNKKKHPPIELPTGKPETGPTPQQLAKVPTADISVSIPGGEVPVESTCKGKNISPAVEWGEIPSGTVELALFVLNLEPINEKLYFDWAVAGIDPSTHGLKAGEAPPGAVIGRNSAGQTKYSICPKGGGTENYVFSLYAITKSLNPKTGFDPLALRKEATHASDSIGLYTTGY